MEIERNIYTNKKDVNLKEHFDLNDKLQKNINELLPDGWILISFSEKKNKLLMINGPEGKVVSESMMRMSELIKNLFIAVLKL